jgi:transcriptional regulator with XRE-family HTH domain
MSDISAEPRFVGAHIRRLREAKGLSRNELAHKIAVDVSSIAGWENGKRLPRETIRTRLAQVLDCALPELMAPHAEPAVPAAVSILDVTHEFPQLFAECARTVRHTLRALRLSSPYSTAVNVQAEARQIISERILAGTLEVQRAEIFYTLDRLKEVLSNILRYDGKAYYVKAYCVGLTEVAPFVGAYIFDDSDLIIGGYWTGYPPQGQPVMRIAGAPTKVFFQSYWKEIWGRGTLLNSHGGRDLSAVKEVALKMGLPARQWRRFVEEAVSLDIGDGAPPLI